MVINNWLLATPFGIGGKEVSELARVVKIALVVLALA